MDSSIVICILLCAQIFITIESAPSESNVIDDDLLIQSEGLYADFPDDEGDEEKLSSRSGKFLHYPLIMDMVKQNPAHNYRPVHQGDPFDFLRDQYPLPSGYPSPMKEYDFVVIGAGSAGSVVASRLSEGKKYSVLLLEAGGPEMILTDVPLLAQYFQSTDYNWGYKAERKDGLCMGMEGERCSWPKGKAVGGSSVINYMIYTRGNRIDWDRIGAENPGWSYDDVLPYFLKSERANLRGLNNSTFHNRDGLLSIEDPKYRTPVAKKFIKAAKQMGHKIIDYNAGELDGFSYVQSHTLNGHRHSTARAFLHPYRTRSNLHIYPYSRVTKININPETKTAKSVEYVRNRLKYTVKAKKEIIISAGALNSPQLLMLSGVGPAEHLKELGIDLIKDLKVGETMYDHISFVGLAFVMNVSGTGIVESDILGKSQNYVDWLSHGTGPLSMTGGVEGLGYIKTNISDDPTNNPDVEYMFVSGCISSDKSSAARKGMNIADWFYDEVYREIVEKPCWTMFPMLLHPKSTGYIKLKDKNPFHWPRFHYDYFSDERDLNTMVEGIKYAIKMSKTKAFQKYGSAIHNNIFPQCKVHYFGSDDYWKCAMRTLGTTMHHQIATCKMGPVSDPGAVVDHELKVYGIKGLRVADTSVIPLPISAHTHAPAVMIGEKVADMIKKTWHSETGI